MQAFWQKKSKIVVAAGRKARFWRQNSSIWQKALAIRRKVW